jgi:murein DD-endopeptidase MepM/ murein hydrolase activator NlpD
MKTLKKIKSFIFSDFTVLIIPKTTRTTKQFRLNAFATYSALAAFVLLNIFVSTFSVYYYNKTRVLDSENTYLNSELSTNLKTVVALKDKTSLQDDEIIELINKNEDILSYLNHRIDEVNELYIEMTNVITSFNSDNNADISVPVSRSLDRASIQNLTSFKNEDDEEAAMDLEEIKEQDALSQVVDTMKSESSNLINEIEMELEYLDCLPDLPPVEGRLSSGFGYRRHPITGLRSFHYGIDITADRNVPIEAAGSGVVVFSGWSGGFGKVLIISHGYGYESVYAHNNALYVS